MTLVHNDQMQWHLCLMPVIIHGILVEYRDLGNPAWDAAHHHVSGRYTSTPSA